MEDSLYHDIVYRENASFPLLALACLLDLRLAFERAPGFDDDLVERLACAYGATLHLLPDVAVDLNGCSLVMVHDEYNTAILYFCQVVELHTCNSVLTIA